MTGNLDIDDHTITGIVSSQDNALTMGGAKATYFPLSGNRAMGGNLLMGNNTTTGIKSSSQDNAALTAQWEMLKLLICHCLVIELAEAS